MMLLKFVVFAFVALKCADSANILGVFPSASISHHILASKLMKGLAKAGHDVTVISPYKLKDLPKNGKYIDVILDGFEEQFQTSFGTVNILENGFSNPLEMMKIVTAALLTESNNTLFHPNVKELLHSAKTFDAVIMEQFSNDALKVFSHIYNCPLIILSSVGPNSWVNPTVGNPQPVSYVPHMFIRDFSKDITFFSRAKNLFVNLLDYFLSNYYVLPKHDEIMHKAFPNAPPLYEVYTNVSLLLLNSHTSLYSAVPLVPNMVEIGGYFIDPPQKLPRDLEDFLDSAKEGAIYFSMGSNLKSKDIPEKKKKAILNVLGKLKEKVLWKFEEELPGKPSNVMIRKWLPQQDVLAHPNIKLFITHGGLLSTTETIYHGVPILAIPVFGDQPTNAQRAVTNGYGLKLEFHDTNFTEETFSDLVNELLKNPSYRENAQRRSKIYHDRPRKPMETAVYWVEYVIRHKGAEHLRVAGVRMPWYEYFMVDVMGVLIFSILLALYSLKLVFKRLICKIGNSNRSSKKQKTN